MLDLTDDQEMLRDAARRFIDDVCPLSVVREHADNGTHVDDSYARQAGELGWFAMLVPEEHGGGSVSGRTVTDAAVIALERGHGLQPGGFVPMNVVADTVARMGSPDQQTEVLPGIASGTTSATWAVVDGTGDWSGPAGVTARPTDGRWVLEGTKTLVPEAASADWVLLTADTDEGPTQFLVPTSTTGVHSEGLAGFDVTRRFGRVSFDAVEVDDGAVVGPVGGAAAAHDRQLALAIALSSLEIAAATDRLFRMTLEYSTDRTAFGRPIGSFQALKHLIANASVNLEGIKGAAAALAEALQTDGPEVDELASITKSFVSERSILVAEDCWQVFGGIAYTWEHDFHLFLRRIHTDAELYGGVAWHRERICRIHEL